MMNSFLAVFQRELRAYFVSPMAWVILTFFLVIQGIIISLIVGFLADPRAPADVTPFNYFFSSFFFWFTQLFITPVITMISVVEGLQPRAKYCSNGFYVSRPTSLYIILLS